MFIYHKKYPTASTSGKQQITASGHFVFISVSRKRTTFNLSFTSYAYLRVFFTFPQLSISLSRDCCRVSTQPRHNTRKGNGKKKKNGPACYQADTFINLLLLPSACLLACLQDDKV